jgi:L-asparaginase type I
MSSTNHLTAPGSLGASPGGLSGGKWRSGRLARRLLKLVGRTADVLVATSSAPSMGTIERRSEKDMPMTHALRQRPDRDTNDQPGSVGLVLTGGTIGAEEDDSVLSVGRDPTRAETGLLADVWPSSSGEPHIVVATPLRQLSENLKPTDWISIAEAVRNLVETENVTGVVVLHGTDTMAYTAAALSFLLGDLDKPIVLTGSNVPSGQPGSDAARNVHTALVAALNLGPGTYVAFAGGADLPGRIYLGTRLRKLRASEEAFASINRELVGVVESEKVVPRQLYASSHDHHYIQAIDDRVLALRLYPGLDFELAFEAVRSGDVRGVVIELYASATGPDTSDRFSVTRFIRRCSDHGVIGGTTVAESPVSNGKTYETTVAIQAAGGVFLRDMLPETATVKMMWALGQSAERNVEQVRDLMLRPIAGEMKPA